MSRKLLSNNSNNSCSSNHSSNSSYNSCSNSDRLSRGHKAIQHPFFAGFFEVDGEFVAID